METGIPTQGHEPSRQYLATLAQLYQRAFGIASQLAGDFADEPLREQLLDQLRQTLDSARLHEQQHSAVRQQLLDGPKDAETRNQLAQLQALIEQTLGAVNLAESAAATARALLVPQLDQQAKTRRVLDAYQAEMRNAARP